MTSTSSYGISEITLQFDLDRDIDAAAQDVQAAINAAASVLPKSLPYPPTYSKVNPADAPIMTLALTSGTVSLRELSDVADTLLAQRLAEVTGVGHVAVQGRIRPAVRIQADFTWARRLRACARRPSDPQDCSTARTSLLSSEQTIRLRLPMPIGPWLWPTAAARPCCSAT